MSENNTRGTGEPGDEATSAAAATSQSHSTASASAASADTKPVTPASSTASPPRSEIPPAAQPGPAASAAQRVSTDAPSSAANVEPVDKVRAQRDDAAQAGAAAANATLARESGARQGMPAAAQEAARDAKAKLAEQVEAATEAHAIEEAEVIEATETTPRPAPRPLPPEFTATPDFGAFNPPPVPPQIPSPAQAPPAYQRRSDSAWSVFGRVIAARARQLFDRAGQRITQRTLRIGVSARIFHPEPGAKGLRGKTLQYLEESIAHWVMSRDVLVFMIPTVGHQGMLHPSNIRLRDYAKHLDGLLLQGGADVSPQSYEEVATRPEWPGDRVRDMYELELLHEFIESGKPVLGVCRGCQLINVAFGGTLYQDIATDVPTAGIHVNEQYDQHRHAIRFPDGSTLSNMFPGRREAVVNSIHHQAVRTLGRDLNIEAVSAGDGIIEAVRYRKAPFVVGVQWHPEFHRAGGDELLDCTPLLDTFLRVSRETRF
jgi:gamma-glutamyl-gamma-aminobutyrate hydrolase PuuD